MNQATHLKVSSEEGRCRVVISQRMKSLSLINPSACFHRYFRKKFLCSDEETANNHDACPQQSFTELPLSKKQSRPDNR